MRWQPRGGRMAKREFYFSHKWQDGWQRLPRRNLRTRVRWWDDEGSDLSSPGDGEPPSDGRELVDSTIDPSIQGRLNGLVETFVCGWPRDKLIRKDGFGMEPPFRRMRPPFSAVVEMRTEHTRTFGFFAGRRKSSDQGRNVRRGRPDRGMLVWPTKVRQTRNSRRFSARNRSLSKLIRTS
jgi:hypothetical protein